MIIVHLGGGRVAIREEPEFVDRTVEVPRVAQRPRIKPQRHADELARARRMEKAHTGYKPGKLIQLGYDQCRYIKGNDHLMCGAKVQSPQSPWCAEHAALIRCEPRHGQRNDQRWLKP